MAKRKAKPKTKAKTNISDSAHKIWLAGLGALVAAEEEGEKLFKTLVTRGKKLEQRVSKPVKKVKSGVSKAQDRAGKAFDEIESAVDQQVTAVLHRLGVPTRDEISKLTRKVERLTRAVDARTGGKPERKRPARSKVVKKKATTRPSSSAA